MFSLGVSRSESPSREDRLTSLQAVQTVGANLAINLEEGTGVNPQGSDAARLLVSQVLNEREEEDAAERPCRFPTCFDGMLALQELYTGLR